jgi:hypothetical protein
MTINGHKKLRFGNDRPVGDYIHILDDGGKDRGLCITQKIALINSNNNLGRIQNISRNVHYVLKKGVTLFGDDAVFDRPLTEDNTECPAGWPSARPQVFDRRVGPPVRAFFFGLGS